MPTQKLKIAFLAPALSNKIGGAESHLKSVITLLKNAGHKLTLVTEAPPTKLISKLGFIGTAIWSKTMPGFPYFKDYDIVISTDLTGFKVKHPRHIRMLMGSYAAFRKDALKTPVGLDIMKKAILDKIALYLENKSGKALACSLGLRNRVNTLGISTFDEVIAPPVSINAFKATPRKEGKRRFNLAQNTTYVGFVGRWEYAKGNDRLISLIEAAPSNLKFIAACPNPQDIPEYLKHKFDFVAPIAAESMRYFYAAATVIVLPTRFEGSSMVIPEAFAVGTPVITTNTGSAHELSLNQALAHLVIQTPDDPQSWLKIIEHCTHDTNLVELANFFKQTYSEPVILKKFNELFDTLLKSQPL